MIKKVRVFAVFGPKEIKPSFKAISKVDKNKGIREKQEDKEKQNKRELNKRKKTDLFTTVQQDT